MQRQPSNGPPQREYEEYRLKSTAAANVSHNIMILNGTTASIQDFTPPVRLLRDRKYYSDDEDDEMDIDQGNKRREPVEAGRGKRKRTRILYLEDEDEIALREQESAPWLLEDFDGQHAFVGRLEGGQTSNYVFFVNQGNEFRVLPASRWYRFNPKPNFQPLTLEEAEAHMSTGRKKEDASRWLMRDRRSGQASDDEEGSPEKVSKLKSLKEQSLRASSASIGGKAKSRGGAQNDYEDLDFEDVFDDDDEGQMDLDIDQENNNDAETRKKSFALSNHGKQVKKLIKNLDRANWNEEFEEDDEDPYADEYEDDEMAKPEVKPPIPQSVPSKILQPAPVKSGLGSKPGAPVGPVPSQVPSPSLSVKKTKPSPPPSTPESMVINESDIIEALSGDQHLTTKDLVSKLKTKLKANPENKEVIKVLMKKLVTVNPETKYLELKPEYK